MRDTPENRAVQEILLNTSQRVIWFRNRVERARPEYNQNVVVLYGLGGFVGSPDYVGIAKHVWEGHEADGIRPIGGWIVWMETKRSDGSGRRRKEQIEFIERMRRQGYIAFFATTSADVHRELDEAEAAVLERTRQERRAR
jgi:hypothetical protein